MECVDFDDENQPVKLKLIDDISEMDYIAITPHLGFERKCSIRWPYASYKALSKARSVESDIVYLTLEDLLYTEDLKADNADNFSSKTK